MIYPENFENKIGFDDIRTLLKTYCLSTLGKEMVDSLGFSDDADVVNEWLTQVREFRLMMEEHDDFPLIHFFDVRDSVKRIKPEGTYMDEGELFDLKRSLTTISNIVNFLNRDEGETSSGERIYPYPALQRLTLDVTTFPMIVQRIDEIIDKFGKIKDNASPELLDIRRELARTEGSVSKALYNILRSAQSDGVVEKDATPTLRDGRLVIPVSPSLKRKIKGIVHDESATGKTVYVEPAEVVEANNRIRELESEERREIIRILVSFASIIRPHIHDMLGSYAFLARIDMIKAKASLADTFKGIEPIVGKGPHIDWTAAVHPLLQRSLEKVGKKVIPLDITLTPQQRILIISGPNAGGKSVCLKTVGLLQYMLQCGLSVPFNEHSRTGVFKKIMIDIGDEQSIENDLSTYSGHLMNMKNMMKYSNNDTLLLIDEFGTGTEPLIGGAIAESVLKQFCNKKAYGIITTHYTNLKHFAEAHEGIVNGAMLYDRNEMKALFQLEIGDPGSSFAIEIARKTGIPEEVIRDASEIVGNEYIQSDKYLQDIVRDKRYWGNKRQNIHQKEVQMAKTIEKYENYIKELETKRREILQKARVQAEELLKETNRRIENTIREIKESQADKEDTRRIRRDLDDYKKEVAEIDAAAKDELIERKMAQLKQRKERKDQRKQERAEQKQNAEKALKEAIERKKLEERPLEQGDYVRIKGLTSVGNIESVEGDLVTVIFGGMRTKMKKSRLERTSKPLREEKVTYSSVTNSTRRAIDERKNNFKQDLDVRGLRGEEAVNAVSYFIDDAILVGMSRVRILHGTGTGILRQLIRQYLSTNSAVSSYKDEHVQFGGAGITVVDLE